MDEKMTLFVNRMKKGKNFILLMIFISIACSLTVTNYVSVPNYQATVQLLVGGERQDIKTLDKYALEDEMEFLGTYKEIIESPLVLKEVKESTKLNISLSELKEGITVDFENNSQVFNISFAHENYETAVLIANATAAAFLKNAEKVMNTNNIALLALADVKDEAALTSMDPSLKLLLAILTAASAGLSLIFFIPEMNTSIRSDSDAEELLAIPVIGKIPKFSERKVNRKTSHS